jgi:hypothetical protein
MQSKKAGLAKRGSMRTVNDKKFMTLIAALLPNIGIRYKIGVIF